MFLYHQEIFSYINIIRKDLDADINTVFLKLKRRDSRMFIKFQSCLIIIAQCKPRFHCMLQQYFLFKTKQI